MGESKKRKPVALGHLVNKQQIKQSSWLFESKTVKILRIYKTK